jgi:hypothetical protein
MELPQDLEYKFAKKISKFEEVKKVEYITSIERIGIKKGLMESISFNLELKFGKEGVRELPNINRIQNIEILRSILNAIKTVKTLEEFRQVYINLFD